MMTSISTQVDEPGAKRIPRIPFLLVLLCAAFITYVQISDADWIEGNFRAIYTIAAILLLLIAQGAWVLFLSGMPWSKRWKIVGAGVAGIAAVVLCLRFLTRRVGSYTGAGFPRLEWIWTKHLAVPPLNVARRSGAHRIDRSVIGPDDFPQFGGPDRDNQVRLARLSRDWSAHPPKLMWRHDVGLGWSGFSTIGKDAITIEQRGEEESTICYDIPTGEPQWAHANHVYLHEPEGGDGPRATPTIAGGRVYTFGGLGNLDCLDEFTGEVIWSRSTLDDPQKQHLRYGQTSSPLIVDQMVIVAGGDGKPQDPRPSLLAFDKKTGKPLWQSVGDPPSYASPLLVTIAGIRQILFVHQNSIVGHFPGNGDMLWHHTWEPGFWPKNSQAVAIGGDRVYCSTGYGIGSIVLQITADSGALSATKVWSSPYMKTEMSNVVIRGDYVLGLDDGRLTCQDLATGAKLWRGARFGHGQILQAGDLLLAQSESGEVALLVASRTGATELGRFTALEHSDNCWNTPALAGHYLLVRSNREAACYLLP